MNKSIVLLAVVFVQACATVASVDRPQSHGRSTAEADGILSGNTLGDDSDKITGLLNYRVKLPAEIRIGILKLNQDRAWSYYSNEFTQLNQSIATNLIQKLRAPKRVYDASFLPAMMVPGERSVSILREAAARFQADLLLCYRTKSESYSTAHIFAANEATSYCSVEAVVLDVRSGIIVKSVVSVEDFSTKKNKADNSFYETRKRAELQAVAKALGNVAQEVTQYLKQVPIE